MLRSSSTQDPLSTLGKCSNFKPLLQSRQLRCQQSYGWKTGRLFVTAATCLHLLRGSGDFLYVLRLQYDDAGQYCCVMAGVGTSANVTVYVRSAVTPPATGNVPTTVASRWNRWQCRNFLLVSDAKILGSSLPSPSVPRTPSSMVANDDGMSFVPALLEASFKS